MSGRFVAPLALLTLAGCSVLVQPDLNRLHPDGGSSSRDVQNVPDSSAGEDVIVPMDDVVSQPDGAAMCPNHCDDNIPCTIDRCNNGTCVNTPDNTACGPDSMCIPGRGCVMNPPMGCNGPADCNDNNPCTVDACNSRMCSNTPVDRDGDRSPAAMVDGTACGFANADCNDNNPAINPSAMEVCDRVDNNCNGMIDELPMCMTMNPNTTCANASRVDLTTTTSMDITGSNAGVASTVQGYCGPRMDLGAGGELWYSITWPQNRDLWIEANRGADWLDPVLWVGETCGRSPIACNDDIANANSNSRVIVRADGLVGTRTVLVAVDAFGAGGGPFTLRLRTQMGGGRDCSSALQLDGGTIRAPTGVASLANTQCSGGGLGGVEHYRYRGAAGNVRVFTSSGNILARRDCTTSSATACIGNGSTFMSGGDSIIALERPMSPYTLTVFGP